MKTAILKKTLWHTISSLEAISQLESHMIRGLSDEQVKDRRKNFGP